MSGKWYSEEFKAEAARQVIDQDRPVREVATRLGVSIHSLYAWVRKQRHIRRFARRMRRWRQRTAAYKPSCAV